VAEHEFVARFVEDLYCDYYGRSAREESPSQTSPLTPRELDAFAELFLTSPGFRTQDSAFPWDWQTTREWDWYPSSQRKAIREHLDGVETLSSFYPERGKTRTVAFDVDLHDEYQRSTANETLSKLRDLASEAYWVTSPRGFHGYLFSDPDEPADLKEASAVLELALQESGVGFRCFGQPEKGRINIQMVEVLPRPGAGMRLPLGALSWPLDRHGTPIKMSKASAVRALLDYATEGPGKGSFERFRHRVMRDRKVTLTRALQTARRRSEKARFSELPVMPEHLWDTFFDRMFARSPVLRKNYLAWRHGIPAFGMRQGLTSFMTAGLASLGLPADDVAMVIDEWLRRPGHVSRDLRADPEGTIQEALEQVADDMKFAAAPQWAAELVHPQQLLEMALSDADLEELRARVGGEDQKLAEAALVVAVWFSARGDVGMPAPKGAWVRLLGSKYTAVRRQLESLAVIKGLHGRRRRGSPRRYQFRDLRDEPGGSGTIKCYQLGWSSTTAHNRMIPWAEGLETLRAHQGGTD